VNDLCLITGYRLHPLSHALKQERILNIMLSLRSNKISINIIDLKVE